MYEDVPKRHFKVAIFNVRERTEVRNNFNHKLVDNLNPKVPQGFFSMSGESIS